MTKNMSIDDRMKESYENRFRVCLPRRTNVILRLDGKSFHSFTKNLKRPFDEEFMDDMDMSAKHLMENIQGAKLAYIQSDEISILITDYDDISTAAWFDNNIQKMCSVSASMLAAKFNQLRLLRKLEQNAAPGISSSLLDQNDILNIKLASFDSRVFVIPEKDEVINYFIWRQQDATRNSVSMAAQSMFSHKQLQGKSSSEMQDMMMDKKNINWNKYPIGFKRGRAIIKVENHESIKNTLEACKIQKEKCMKNHEFEKAKKLRQRELGILKQMEKNPTADLVRKNWEIVEPPIFTEDREFIMNQFPE